MPTSSGSLSENEKEKEKSTSLKAIAQEAIPLPRARGSQNRSATMEARSRWTSADQEVEFSHSGFEEAPMEQKGEFESR